MQHSCRYIFGFFFACLFLYDSHSLAASSQKKSTAKPHTHSIRALHIVTRWVSITQIKKLIDKAKAAHFNALILGLMDGVRLNSYPGKLLKSAWSKEEFLEVVQYARQHGMEVIPEVKLLTHQERFLQNSHPEMRYNKVTYDPRNTDIYNEVVFPYLNELIALMHPKSIHIGHDEAVGWNKRHAEKKLNKGERGLPADLYVKDVVRIHDYLKEKGIETWMWGDMLIGPKEFPEMLVRHLHGSMPGYGQPLRNQLPRDIVICDWHNFDTQNNFPSLMAFKKEGFQVLGSTWKNQPTIKNFSRYAYNNRADGMVATTWFHVQRKEWGIVDKIIQESGRSFWDAQ